MASEMVITKRLIGKQDIDWDTTGEGALNEFVTSNLMVKQVHKINSSHIPLTKSLRTTFDGATNLDEAFAKLNGKISFFSNFQFMSESKIVDIKPIYTQANIQTAINEQIKNLGGNTLTFSFPANKSYVLTSPLVFSSFNNGTIVIDVDNVSFADSSDIVTLFHFVDCDCVVKLKGINFNVNYSDYAILFERGKFLLCDTCYFIGHDADNCYAVYFNMTDGEFTNCVFTTISQKLTKSILSL